MKRLGSASQSRVWFFFPNKSKSKPYPAQTEREVARGADGFARTEFPNSKFRIPVSEVFFGPVAGKNKNHELATLPFLYNGYTGNLG